MTNNEIRDRIDKFFADADCITVSRGCFYVRECLRIILCENIVIELTTLREIYMKVAECNKLAKRIFGVEKSITRFIYEIWQNFPHLFKNRPAIKEFILRCIGEILKS